MPKLSIDSLAIETTRRCNMRCDHCLRGDAESKEMPLGLIDALLDQCEEIGEVTFSGGEPSLALDVIREFYARAELRKIPVRSFFIATNGRENQEELAVLALRLYARAEDKDRCSVAVSDDGFHDIDSNRHILKGLAFYSDVKSRDINDCENWAIRRGRAYENGFGRDVTPSVIFSTERMPDGTIHVDTLYLSCNGYAYPDCDLTYEDMDAVLKNRDDCPCDAIEAKDIFDVLDRQTD